MAMLNYQRVNKTKQKITCPGSPLHAARRARNASTSQPPPTQKSGLGGDPNGGF